MRLNDFSALSANAIISDTTSFSESPPAASLSPVREWPVIKPKRDQLLSWHIHEMHCRRSFPARDFAKHAAIQFIGAHCNRRRPHSTIGYKVPAEAMAARGHGCLLRTHGAQARRVPHDRLIPRTRVSEILIQVTFSSKSPRFQLWSVALSTPSPSAISFAAPFLATRSMTAFSFSSFEDISCFQIAMIQDRLSSASSC